MDAPEDHLFGRPTSDDTIYEWEDPNVDRSKNTALIPPGFAAQPAISPAPASPDPQPGSRCVGGRRPGISDREHHLSDCGQRRQLERPSFTAVTSDLYYSGGYLGTLKIPAIGLSVRVYEGTDSGTFQKGRSLPAPASGMGMFVLQATTGVYRMTLETCTP